jgi:hypothetical protein
VHMVDISSLGNKGMTTRESGQVCWQQRRDQNVDFNRTSLFEKILCADVTLRSPAGSSKLRRRHDFKQEKRKWKIGERLLKRDQR